MSHAWHDVPTGKNAPVSFNAVIVTPMGSKVRYDLDRDTGLLKVVRILYSSMVYPANHGFIPQTLSDDGGPLDALVLMQVPVVPLCVLYARAIGLLRRRDQGRHDETIIGVHLDDPGFRSYHATDELPRHHLAEVRRFFEDYQELEGRAMPIEDFLDASAACQTIQAAMDRYGHLERE